MCCIKIVKIFKFKFQNQNNWLYVAREILYSQKCVPKLPMEIPPGGGLPYENDENARRKIRIKPLKETNLGVVQALFDP